jgi:hypothetical protein
MTNCWALLNCYLVTENYNLLAGRKRRISDDEDMTLAPSAADPSFQFGKALQSSLRPDMKAKTADSSSKRSKTDIDKHLSVTKLLGKIYNRGTVASSAYAQANAFVARYVG